MIFKSQVITQASGSVGGVTYSHNAGGMYQRARTIPTNPNSTFQQTVRAIFGNLANAWSTTLTAAQRALWADYAANVPVINALGDPINLNPLAMFVRCNTPRVQAALPLVLDGPTTFNLGDFTNPSFGFDATDDEVDVTFEATDAWAGEDDAGAIILASRPKAPTINFFKGPYRLAGIIAGDSVTPPTSPAAITAPFEAVAGQKVFVRFIVSRADGRLSLPFRGVATAA